MSKKNTKKIVIGIITVVVIFIGVFFLIKNKDSKRIKIGMNKDKVVSVLDKLDFKYEYIHTNSFDMIIINRTYIDNIEGSCTIFFEENKVFGARFLANTDKINSIEDRDKIVKQLKTFLSKKYGKPFEQTDGDIFFVKGNMYAEIIWEYDLTIDIEWGPFNIS